MMPLKKKKWPEHHMQVKPCVSISGLYQCTHWLLTGASELGPVYRDSSQVFAGTMIWWDWNVNEASHRVYALVKQDYALMLTAADTESIVILREDSAKLGCRLL